MHNHHSLGKWSLQDRQQITTIYWDKHNRGTKWRGPNSACELGEGSRTRWFSSWVLKINKLAFPGGKPRKASQGRGNIMCKDTEVGKNPGYSAVQRSLVWVEERGREGAPFQGGGWNRRGLKLEWWRQVLCGMLRILAPLCMGSGEPYREWGDITFVFQGSPSGKEDG